ncbi:hypothetical protein BDR06DRAFT_1039216 [Suillus hirtellus]|nr:hypothetical protein BDR06DRAFT_1039216 [Suillus hirtellus]
MFNLKDHHYIPTLSQNNPLDIFHFLHGHDDDPAVTVGTGLHNHSSSSQQCAGICSQTQEPLTISASKVGYHTL